MKKRHNKIGVNFLSRDALISRARSSRSLFREAVVKMASWKHSLDAIGRNIFEKSLVKIRDIAYESIFGRSRLSFVRPFSSTDARVPSLNPTKGPFRVFRALRLAGNEGNRSSLDRSLIRRDQSTRRHRYLSAMWPDIKIYYSIIPHCRYMLVCANESTRDRSRVLRANASSVVAKRPQYLCATQHLYI